MWVGKNNALNYDHLLVAGSQKKCCPYKGQHFHIFIQSGDFLI